MFANSGFGTFLAGTEIDRQRSVSGVWDGNRHSGTEIDTPWDGNRLSGTEIDTPGREIDNWEGNRHYGTEIGKLRGFMQSLKTTKTLENGG